MTGKRQHRQDNPSRKLGILPYAAYTFIVNSNISCSSSGGPNNSDESLVVVREIHQHVKIRVSKGKVSSKGKTR